MQQIFGVEIKDLTTHEDPRGFFREIIRHNDPFFEGAHFAQWSHSRMIMDVVKAWHYHHIQYDWWYLPIGKIRTVLIDNREESPTFKKTIEINMGEKRFGEDTRQVCVKIPPGVLHGCRVLSDEAHLFYITSEVYNPNEEGRFPFNNSPIPYNWGDGALTVENDRRTFVPHATRIKLAL